VQQSNQSKSRLKYYAVYKPDGMLSQFSNEGNKQTLANFEFAFPKDVYPIGRLDEMSEGLLLFSNDSKVNQRLLNPKFQHGRKYLVCVIGQITQDALSKMHKGVTIKVKGKTHLARARSIKMVTAPILEDKRISFSYSKEKGLSWIEIELTEGKNRQVRKMTAAVGFPTVRLVRY